MTKYTLSILISCAACNATPVPFASLVPQRDAATDPADGVDGQVAPQDAAAHNAVDAGESGDADAGSGDFLGGPIGVPTYSLIPGEAVLFGVAAFASREDEQMGNLLTGFASVSEPHKVNGALGTSSRGNALRSDGSVLYLTTTNVLHKFVADPAQRSAFPRGPQYIVLDDPDYQANDDIIPFVRPERCGELDGLVIEADTDEPILRCGTDAVHFRVDGTVYPVDVFFPGGPFEVEVIGHAGEALLVNTGQDEHAIQRQTEEGLVTVPVEPSPYAYSAYRAHPEGGFWAVSWHHGFEMYRERIHSDGTRVQEGVYPRSLVRGQKVLPRKCVIEPSGAAVCICDFAQLHDEPVKREGILMRTQIDGDATILWPRCADLIGCAGKSQTYAIDFLRLYTPP